MPNRPVIKKRWFSPISLLWSYCLLETNSSYIYHAANSTHSIDYEGVVVKAREEDWFKRGVKEAIHIKRKASDLNKDKGRHQLPSVYDSIISSDQSTTSGQMTQSHANSNTNISRH